MDGNEERDKKQSALPKQLQEKFMTTDSAVLWRKKLNSREHYTDLDSVNFTRHKDYFASSWVNFVSGVIKCNTCAWNIWTNYLIKKNEKGRSNTPRVTFLYLGQSIPPKNALEMKGRYEVCGQELKLKDYIKLERNSGYDHTVTDEFWTTGHSVYTKPCESFVLFRWN